MDTRNVVVLNGRLAADPELRYLQDGTPVGNFAIAVNRTVMKPDGGTEETLDGFFDCHVFGGVAVTAAEELRKGSEAQLTGFLVQRKFKARDGRSASKVEVRVKSLARPLVAARPEPAPDPVQESIEPQPV